MLLGAVAISSLGTFGMHVILPALPAIAAHFAIPAATTQLLVSLALLSIALGNLTVAPLSDRFGRRPITLAGIGLFLCGSLLGLVAPTIEVLIVARVLQAYGGGAAMAVVRATIMDSFGPERAPTAIAYTAMAVLVVPMIAPTLSGFAVEWFGWRSPFAMISVLEIAVLTFTWLRIQESHEQGSRPQASLGMLASYRALLCNPDYLAYTFYSAFILAAVYTFIAGAPYIAIRLFGLSPSSYGLMYLLPATAAFSGFFMAGRLSRRKGHLWMMRVGLLISMSGGLLLLALMGAGLWAPLALFVPGMLLGFANAVSAPNSTSRAIAQRPDVAGAASGLLGFIQLGTSALAAQAVAFFTSATPIPLAVIVTVLNLLALGCFSLIRRRDGHNGELSHGN
jgi:DHA1 family bicyclomycin/chloramphenicol resistance-like MFS transporter